MFESTSLPNPICERCGHDDTYHTTTRCVRTEGGYGKTQEQRGVCDCPGWKRDLLWPFAAPEDRADGLDPETLATVSRKHVWIGNAAFARMTGVKKVCMDCGAPSNNAPKECPGRRADQPEPR